MERTQIELDPSSAAAHYVWSWPSCLTEPQSLCLSYGTGHFPVQVSCEDYHAGSMRKRLGQSVAHGEPASMLIVSEGQRCGTSDFKRPDLFCG